jgi:hypothetical protein
VEHRQWWIVAMIRGAEQCGAFVELQCNGECAKLWAGLVFGDEMDNQAGI